MSIMGVMRVLIPIKLILILPFHKIYVPVNCEMKRTIYDKFTKHTKLLIFIGYTDFHEILLIFFFFINNKSIKLLCSSGFCFFLMFNSICSSSLSWITFIHTHNFHFFCIVAIGFFSVYFFFIKTRRI